MVDVVSKKKRSQMMSGIRGKDTRPERIVRSILHSRGFRYRLHDKNLPGKPDLVLRKHGCVLLVNGCFWHGHKCHLFKWPTTRKGFWREKIEKNRSRDAVQISALQALGWRVVIVWECAIKGKERVDPEELASLMGSAICGSDAVTEIRGVK